MEPENRLLEKCAIDLCNPIINHSCLIVSFNGRRPKHRFLEAMGAVIWQKKRLFDVLKKAVFFNLKELFLKSKVQKNFKSLKKLK